MQQSVIARLELAEQPPSLEARGATLRRDLIAVAARFARHGGWHRQAAWMNLLDAACGPPAAPA
jgi:hypothetical protein